MATAIIFVSYHPQYLLDYANLCAVDGGRSKHILILCRHSYLSDAIISEYSSKFDHVLILPDLSYDINIFKAFPAFRKFKKKLSADLAPVLSGITSYRVISCCSAWPPVNVVLSLLCRGAKFRSLSTVCEHATPRGAINFFRTLLVSLYSRLFGLRPSLSTRVHGYFYRNNPWDSVLRFIGPYGGPCENSGDGKVFCIRRPPRIKRRTAGPGMVVFYSDRNLDDYNSVLTEDERRLRLQRFMSRFGEFYGKCEIVCKPHPLDKGMPIEEMNAIKFTVFDKPLLAQMHLHQNMDRIVACYSISSTSLLYAASIGVPSYTLFRYMGYGADPNLRFFFDGASGVHLPFLRNISALDEIGRIDDIDAKPSNDNAAAEWDRLVRS